MNAVVGQIGFKGSNANDLKKTKELKNANRTVTNRGWVSEYNYSGVEKRIKVEFKEVVRKKGKKKGKNKLKTVTKFIFDNQSLAKKTRRIEAKRLLAHHGAISVFIDKRNALPLKIFKWGVTRGSTK